jgi:Uma2 family endonuclease
MPAARHHRLTLDDCFALERRSPDKWEFDDGRISAMAGGSPRHNYICGRIQVALAARLDGGPCFALTADQRISTADGLYTYADASVYCGDIEVAREDTALNPVVIFEVLSDSTRDYDRGDKLERYKSIPSLRHVVLVDQQAVDVEVWTRGPRGWTRRVHTDPTDVLVLDALHAEVPVDELYAGSERLPA